MLLLLSSSSIYLMLLIRFKIYKYSTYFRSTVNKNPIPQLTIKCSKLAIEALEQGMKYVQI